MCKFAMEYDNNFICKLDNEECLFLKPDLNKCSEMYGKNNQDNIEESSNDYIIYDEEGVDSDED